MALYHWAEGSGRHVGAAYGPTVGRPCLAPSFGRGGYSRTVPALSARLGRSLGLEGQILTSPSEMERQKTCRHPLYADDVAHGEAMDFCGEMGCRFTPMVNMACGTSKMCVN